MGKTTLVEQFGKSDFENLVAANFELQPAYAQCFDSLLPQEIISAIEIVSGQPIVPGKTLLFLDEIQECPRAIMALRYFKEKMPELHVIGAGSLLEFALHGEAFRMPVGRVQYLYLGPLSFNEFLDAIGYHKLRKLLHEVTVEKPPSQAIHLLALELARKYAALGGMPDVVKRYIENEKIADSKLAQLNLLSTYRDDLGK